MTTATRITDEELAAFHAAVLADIAAQHAATLTAAEVQRQQMVFGITYQLGDGDSITKKGDILRRETAPPPASGA